MTLRGTEVMLTKAGIDRGKLKSALGPMVFNWSI